MRVIHKLYKNEKLKRYRSRGNNYGNLNQRNCSLCNFTAAVIVFLRWCYEFNIGNFCNTLLLFKIKKMKIFEIFKGDKGEFSSKRFVGIVGSLVLFGRMIYSPMPELIQAVEYIAIFSLGFTSFDKFTNGKTNSAQDI